MLSAKARAAWPNCFSDTRSRKAIVARFSLGLPVSCGFPSNNPYKFRSSHGSFGQNIDEWFPNIAPSSVEPLRGVDSKKMRLPPELLTISRLVPPSGIFNQTDHTSQCRLER